MESAGIGRTRSALPESLVYLAVRGRVEQVRLSLGRIESAQASAGIDVEGVVPEKKAPSIPVGGCSARIGPST